MQPSWTDVTCDELIASIEKLIHEKQQALKLNRLQLWRKKLRDSFDLHRHGAAAFAWVNNQSISCLHAVPNSNNEIVTSVGDMLQAVSTSWQNLFNKNSQVNMETLGPIASSVLPSHPCELPNISGAKLKKKVMGMKQYRAVALDGWRVSELRFLPVQWFDLVAQCFSKIEQGAPWPLVCCLGSISTIPKGSADDPENQPAGEVIAADGLQTRPITNLSPLYTAYSGCRYAHMQQWRETWLTDCMSGSRPKREIHDCSYSLALQLEYQTHSGNHSAGISMDRTKFFDLIEYPFGFHLLHTLGAPQGVLQATQRLYCNLKHVYKLRRATSIFYTKGNGFPQGDSWSLQVALGIMSFWTRYLKADPMQDMAIHSGSFLDDSHFHCSHTELAPVVSSLIQAWKRSLEFDDLAGLKTNNKKSFFFANNSVLRKNISEAMQELPIEQQLSYRDSFVLVGSVVTSYGAPMITNRDKRVAVTAQKLHKVRFAPVRFAYRARMAGAICKSAVFGTELVPLTQTLSETLRSSIVFLLWKGKSWCRSWAVTSTHIVPVHMLHPQAACFYHMFTLLGRLLRRRDDSCDIFRRFRAETCETTGYGPFSLVLQAMDTLGATWTDTFQFVTLEDTHSDFIHDHPEAFKHKLRECLRHYVLRSNAAFNKRHDMVGGPLLAYDANVTLLQQKGRGKKTPLTLFQQNHLRNILTGAVHTNQRLFQANCASTPVCSWCDSGQHEDHEHLFWQCQRWQHLRDSFVQKYTAVIPQLSPCTKLCGLLSCDLVANWPLSISPTQFIQEFQIMFIKILQERDSLKTKVPRNMRLTPKALDDHTHQPIIPTSHELKLSKERLFPNYPWSYDIQHCFPTFPMHAFPAKLPKTSAYTVQDLSGCLDWDLSNPSIGTGANSGGLSQVSIAPQLLG